MNYEPIFIKKFKEAWPDETKYHALLKEGNIKDIERFFSQKTSPITVHDILKVKNFSEIMGYVGYVSGNENDRRKLFVKEIYPLKRKSDGAQFGYSIITQSIGSGIESRFTVFNRLYNNAPIKKGDIILCTGFSRDGVYFTLTGYTHLYTSVVVPDESVG